MKNIKNQERIKRAYSMNDLVPEESGVIEGYASVFNEPADVNGYFEEVIDPSAFNDADLTDVLLLVNHDLGRIPLARSRRNTPNSSLQLQVDSKGLKIKTTLDLENNQEARAVHSAVTRGDLSGMSFLMTVAESRWERFDTDYPRRTITKVGKVYEVSVVNMPVYDGTSVNARSEDSLESAKIVLENAKSTMLESRKSLEVTKAKTLFDINKI